MKVMLELPDELVQEARELGVLEDDVVIDLLRSEVDRRVMDRVNGEIQAYRREKRRGMQPDNNSLA